MHTHTHAHTRTHTRARARKYTFAHEHAHAPPQEKEEGEITPRPAEPAKPLTALEIRREKKRAADAEIAARRRMLGNIQFIGYLYKFSLLTERCVRGGTGVGGARAGPHCTRPSLAACASPCCCLRSGVGLELGLAPVGSEL